MTEDPEQGPEGPASAPSQPENRKALPAPHHVPSRPELGPPMPVVDESERAVREPPVDVVRGRGRLYITIEIPGAARESIDIQASEHRLTIRAPGYNGFVYHKELELPERIEPDAVRSAYRNGVLDITVPLAFARKIRVRRGEDDV